MLYAKRKNLTVWEITTLEQLNAEFQALDISIREDYENVLEWIVFNRNVVSLPTDFNGKTLYYFFDEAEGEDSIVTADELKKYFVGEDVEQYSNDFDAWLFDLERWHIITRITLQ